MKKIALQIIIVVSTCFGLGISICKNEIRAYCRNSNEIELSIDMSNEELYKSLKSCKESLNQNDNYYYINTCSLQRVKELIEIIESLDLIDNIKLVENNSNDTISIVGYHIDDFYVNDELNYSSYNKIIDATGSKLKFCVQKNDCFGGKWTTKTICGSSIGFIDNCFTQFKDSVYKIENNIKVLKIDSTEAFGIKDADKKWIACFADSNNYNEMNYERVEYDYIFIPSKFKANNLIALLKMNKREIEDSRFGDDRYIKYKIRIK